MDSENVTCALLNTLEEQLVKEFRVCSRLRDLTKEERSALVSNNVSTLSSVVELKEAVLDELGRLDDARRSTTDHLSNLLGIHDPSLSVARLMSALEPAVAEKFARLRDGILAMMNQIGELTHGNSLLAAAALERNTALQTFLLDQYQPMESYAPPGRRSADTPIAMGYDHRT